MATIAVLSQKGGTGKTTAVRTLTDIFRRLDLRVLAVDLDPQGNLSDYLDVDPEASPTIADVLSDRADPREAVHDGIIPANLGLAEAELMLGGKMGRELSLKKALREPFAEKLLDTTIRASIAYAESAERAVSILDYRPDLAADYLNVADELLRRLDMNGARDRLGALVKAAV